MIYTAYSGENIKRIRVSGETLPNGNSSAEIEIVYENEIGYEEPIKGIYYCEYGNNPSRVYIGNEIRWCGDTFKILQDGKYLDGEYESEEDESEEN